MSKRTPEQLQRWYRQFAKEVYDKANIKVDCIADLGRIKNFHITSWDDNSPLEPQGQFQYAYVPHDGLTYDNPPPDASDYDEYFDWLTNNLQPATTDDQIEELMEMSMAGTLMIYAPGAQGSQMQQVYTDDEGRITVSMPMNEMDGSGRENVAPNRRLPNPPMVMPIPNPDDYGLHDYPPKPVRPKNMNPGFFSWLGYVFGINTDYAKKKRYEDDVRTYDTRFREWLDGLDDVTDPEARVQEYRVDRQVREQYMQQLQEFKSQPLGMARAIENGYRVAFERKVAQEQPLPNSREGKRPSEEERTREMHFLRAEHYIQPHGKLYSISLIAKADTEWAMHSQEALTQLLGHNPSPDDLQYYLFKMVYQPNTFHPQPYDLPQLEGNHSRQEQEAFKAKMAEVAEIASFAALANENVTGTIMPREGFSKADSAKLNYTMVLDNVMTGPRPQSSQFMEYLYPARELGRKAMEEYAKGNVKPLADLLRDSILRTNKEAAVKDGFASSYSSNTLYYIRRMYELMQRDDRLMKAVNLSKEDEAETKANVEMHKVATKAMEARRLLVDYARNQVELTPEQLREAAIDIRFAYSINQQVAASRAKNGAIVENSEEYIAALEGYGQCNMEAAKMPAIDESAPNAAQLKAQKAELDARLLFYQNQMDLQNTNNLRACEYLQNLLDENWVRDAKAALGKACNIDKIFEMPRESIGRLLESTSGMEFAGAFQFRNDQPNVAQNDQPVAVIQNGGINMA